MVYKLGRGNTMSLKSRLFWGVVLVGTFISGCNGTATAMIYTSDSYSFTDVIGGVLGGKIL